MRRPRGPGGRFLTAEEVAAMDKAEAEGNGGDMFNTNDLASGSKRKASESDGPSGSGVKRSRMYGDDHEDVLGNG